MDEGQITSGEAAFERWRKRAGLFLAPAAAILIAVAPLSLSYTAHQLLAIIAAVVILWITEAVPLPVTALLGPALCVVIGIAPVKDVFRSFADPVIFVYLGGFLLAEAILEHGLNRRIAFKVLTIPGVAKSPTGLLAGFAVITAAISMWVSNTATTAMMLPIGLAIISEVAREQSRRLGRDVPFTTLKFGTALMLMAAFASSVGGLATPVGTPPNLVGIGLIEQRLGIRISFFQWMAIGAPLALCLVVVVIAILARACRGEETFSTEGTAWLREQQSALGPMSRAEKNVVFAFSLTVTLWVLPGLLALIQGSSAPMVKWFNAHLPESVVALLGASLLFVLPVRWRNDANQRAASLQLAGGKNEPADCKPAARWLAIRNFILPSQSRGEIEFTLTWREAQRIDWGTVLLFGGGLALGELMFTTGLAQWIGEGMAHAFEANSAFGLVALFTGVAILVSETTSNLASASMVVPVAIAVAKAAGVNPLQPALAACLGASMGFMLPVSTPPNAIVYGSRCVPILKMVRYGVMLDVAGYFVIVAGVHWLVPLVFG